MVRLKPNALLNTLNATLLVRAALCAVQFNFVVARDLANEEEVCLVFKADISNKFGTSRIRKSQMETTI